MTRLIYGINPLTISSIVELKFVRRGDHPSWIKLMKKRNPIRGFLGLYSPGLFDGIYAPAVVIKGAGGRDLKHITCRSQAAAKSHCNELNAELSAFLDRLTCTIDPT